MRYARNSSSFNGDKNLKRLRVSMAVSMHSDFLLYTVSRRLYCLQNNLPAAVTRVLRTQTTAGRFAEIGETVKYFLGDRGFSLNRGPRIR